ncbi:MAG TPA: TIGR02594 family protein [Hyphomicrobium sp.]|nr:TIGR02594 family protein [Hyphomicrobium sp.]
MEQPAWMAAAWAEFGVRETPGPGNSPKVLAYYREAGRADINQDAVAWCAAFIGAMLARAGVVGTGSLLARSYLDWGIPIEAGRVGAIAVLSRGSDPNAGHAGFLVGQNETELFLLGGNQDDSVSVAAFDTGRLLGFRWPKGDMPAQPGAIRQAGMAHDTDSEERDGVFAASLAHVLNMEGGFSNDPYDPGGPTNQGITLEVFARQRGVTVTASSRARLIEELKQIPGAMVREIYRTRYWQPGHCAKLPAPLALFHFDACVNHGVAGAARLLQRAAGTQADGEIGPNTLAAIGARPPLEVVASYAALRRQRYRALAHFWRFGRGWLARVDAGEAQAARLAASQPALSVQASANAPATSPAGSRADIEPPTQGASPMDPITYPDEIKEPAQTKWWGHSKTIWGALITAAATLAPVLGTLLGIELSGDVVREVGEQTIGAIQAVMALFGTLLTIYGRLKADGPVARKNVNLKL